MSMFVSNLKKLIELFGVDSAIHVIEECLQDHDVVTMAGLTDSIGDEIYYAIQDAE